MQYRIERLQGSEWCVYSGRTSFEDFIRHDIVFKGGIADCYAWIKAKKEGLAI